MSGTTPVWVIRAGGGGSLAAQCEASGLVAISFPAGGDATGASKAELTARFKAAGFTHPGRSAGQLWRFASEIAVGDLVVVPVRRSRELLIGRFTGDYVFQPRAVIPGYSNVRSVEWLRRVSRDLLPKRVLYSLGALLTVFSPAGQPELRTLALGELPKSNRLNRQKG